MNWQEVSLEKLKKAPWNYKTDSDEKLEKLKEGIRTHGFLVNLIIRDLPDGFFEVVNGNHRLDALDQTGATTAMCRHLGVISEEEAQLIALETNENSFDTDDLKLAQIFKRLDNSLGMERLTATLNASENKIRDLIALADYKFNPEEGATPASNSPSLSIFKTISYQLPEEVADQFSEQVRRLLRLLGKDENGPPVAALELMANFIAQTGDLDFGL